MILRLYIIIIQNRKSNNEQVKHKGNCIELRQLKYKTRFLVFYVPYKIRCQLSQGCAFLEWRNAFSPDRSKVITRSLGRAEEFDVGLCLIHGAELFDRGLCILSGNLTGNSTLFSKIADFLLHERYYVSTACSYFTLFSQL